MKIYKDVKAWYVQKGISTEQFFKDSSIEMGLEEMMNDFASRMLLRDKQLHEQKLFNFITSENAFEKWFSDKLKIAPSKEAENDIHEFKDLMKHTFCEAAKIYLQTTRELTESLEAERTTKSILRDTYEKLEKRYELLAESNKNHKHHHDQAIAWWNKAEEKVKLLLKAVNFYGSKDLWSITNNYPTHVTKRTIIESSVDTEWFEEEKQHVSGGIARKVLADFEKLEEKLPEVTIDAKRWQALLSCKRIRILGCAGLGNEDYQHIGLELWDTYPHDCVDQNEINIKTLNTFMDTVIKRNEK